MLCELVLLVLIILLFALFFLWCFSSVDKNKAVYESNVPVSKSTSKEEKFILEGLLSEDVSTLSDAKHSEKFKRLTEKERKIVDGGYPVWKKDRLYYSVSNLHPHIVPYYPPKIEEIRRHRVPANIFQGFNHRVLQDDYYHSISSTISLNPTYHYHFYDTYACRELIGKHLGKRVLKAYDTLIPGAYRSDLWRLCVLYVHGGIYMDLKLHPTHGFNDIVNEDTEFAMAVEEPQSTNFRPSMLTSFMASIPRHPFLLACIEAIVDRVEKREFGVNEWDVTGPLLYASTMQKLCGSWPPSAPNMQVGTAQWHPDLMVYYDGVGKIKLRIPETNNEERFSTMTPEPYYRILYKEKKIYNEEI